MFLTRISIKPGNALAVLSAAVIILTLGCAGSTISVPSAVKSVDTQTKTRDASASTKGSRVSVTRDRVLAITVPSDGQGTPIVFDNVIEDTLGEYDITRGTFTPKSPGVYQVIASLSLSGPYANGDYCKLFLERVSASDSVVVAVSTMAMPNTAGSNAACSVTLMTSVTMKPGQALVIFGAVSAGEVHSTNAATKNPYTNLNITRIAD